MNFMLTASDAQYPQKGGISALVGIYESEERAQFIQEKVIARYGTESIFAIEPTTYTVTEPIKIN